MIPINVQCPKCNKSLMDGSLLIDKVPSIKLKAEVKGKKGTIWLSSLYGSYKVHLDLPDIKNEIYKFYCPHCNEEIPTSKECSICSAPMKILKIQMGGKVEFCSRRNCKKHSLEFETEEELQSFYETMQPYLKIAP